MKLKIIAGAAAALFTITTVNLQANPVTNLVTITATAVSQNVTNVSKGVATIESPSSKTINTKLLLQWLAVDEYAESNYTATNFPSGAQLVVITEGDTNADYQVLNKTNLALVDVSDIIRADHGSNYVFSGKVTVSTGVYDPSITALKVAKFVFDDSGVVAGAGRSVVDATFYLGGLETKVTTDSLPNSSGKYTEIISANVGPCAGEGTYKGTPIIVTGSFGFSAVLNRKD